MAMGSRGGGVMLCNIEKLRWDSENLLFDEVCYLAEQRSLEA
jgi:hypothetical protein